MELLCNNNGDQEFFLDTNNQPFGKFEKENLIDDEAIAFEEFRLICSNTTELLIRLADNITLSTLVIECNAKFVELYVNNGEKNNGAKYFQTFRGEASETETTCPLFDIIIDIPSNLFKLGEINLLKLKFISIKHEIINNEKYLLIQNFGAIPKVTEKKSLTMASAINSSQPLSSETQQQAVNNLPIQMIEKLMFEFEFRMRNVIEEKINLALIPIHQKINKMEKYITNIINNQSNINS